MAGYGFASSRIRQAKRGPSWTSYQKDLIDACGCQLAPDEIRGISRAWLAGAPVDYSWFDLEGLDFDDEVAGVS